MTECIQIVVRSSNRLQWFMEQTSPNCMNCYLVCSNLVSRYPPDEYMCGTYMGNRWDDSHANEFLFKAMTIFKIEHLNGRFFCLPLICVYLVWCTHFSRLSQFHQSVKFHDWKSYVLSVYQWQTDPTGYDECTQIILTRRNNSAAHKFTVAIFVGKIFPFCRFMTLDLSNFHSQLFDCMLILIVVASSFHWANS